MSRYQAPLLSPNEFRRYQCQATVLVVALTDMEKEDLVITMSNLINLMQLSNRSKGVAVLFFFSRSLALMYGVCTTYPSPSPHPLKPLDPPTRRNVPYGDQRTSCKERSPQ